MWDRVEGCVSLVIYIAFSIPVYGNLFWSMFGACGIVSYFWDFVEQPHKEMPFDDKIAK